METNAHGVAEVKSHLNYGQWCTLCSRRNNFCSWPQL